MWHPMNDKKKTSSFCQAMSLVFMAARTYICEVDGSAVDILNSHWAYRECPTVLTAVRVLEPCNQQTDNEPAPVIKFTFKLVSVCTFPVVLWNSITWNTATKWTDEGEGSRESLYTTVYITLSDFMDLSWCHRLHMRSVSSSTVRWCRTPKDTQ